MNFANVHPFSLEGKIAIVTGAGRGIGRATAGRLARDGAIVIATDIDEASANETAEMIRGLGGSAEPKQLDVTNASTINEKIQSIVKKYNKIDIMVNNAGILRGTPASEITDEEWDRLLRVNLTGTFYCCRAVYPIMAAKKYGRIINMGSTAGKSTSTMGGASYTTAKSAIHGLTRHLAREWGSERITVNAVCPGVVDTTMIKGLISDDAFANVVKSIPLKRMASPEEVAALIAFLASDDAAFITGASVDINGGELLV